MYSVVIIDDNKIAVEAIAKSTNWESCGCQVAGTAYDGISGLELIRRVLPQIVIIDIQMPGFNGLDIVKKLKSENPEIQFIIISGYSQFEYAQKAIRYGVSDYLLKPIMTEDMEQALCHVTELLRRNITETKPEPMDSLEERLYEIRAGKMRYSALVAQAVDYVGKNLHRNITLADVCRELLVSTGYFSKCFKKETGIGFAAYVTMVKMENARILLKNPQNRVNEVAHMLGYSDYTYFFQVFKKQFGYAPSDIKTSVKKEKEEKENDSDTGK
ncbi:MAG: response regulator [Enterocloster sp.]